MDDYEIKERIIDRLHASVGVCMYCGKSNCKHGSNTTLPNTLNLADVIDAIALDTVEKSDE